MPARWACPTPRTTTPAASSPARWERRLIAAANGLGAPGDPALEGVIASRKPGVLSRVINLETGSLAVEAALKMMLARFYSLDGSSAPYAGRIPVFLVMADQAGGLAGNYHGTTVVAQTLRGLWPEFTRKMEDAGIYRVVSVPINDAAGFRQAIETWNTPPCKTAGFCHEIIMMNYGGHPAWRKRIFRPPTASAAKATRRCCATRFSPAPGDEGLFLFRQYGLAPDFVSVGKGFPGGVYPASRLLLSGAFDILSQFGALVTNGQEELASLAYLITMAFIEANGPHIRKTGRLYHEEMRGLADRHPDLCVGVAGDAHMTALHFHRVEDATAFCHRMAQERCVDISAQTYKPNWPARRADQAAADRHPAMVRKLAALFEEALEGKEAEA